MGILSEAAPLRLNAVLLIGKSSCADARSQQRPSHVFYILYAHPPSRIPCQRARTAVPAAPDPPDLTARTEPKRKSWHLFLKMVLFISWFVPASLLRFPAGSRSVRIRYESDAAWTGVVRLASHL